MADDEATLHYAGACRPDPGCPSIGFVIKQNNKVVEQFSACLGSFTISNIGAHYKALIAGLKYAYRHNIKKIKAFGHCRDVYYQVNERRDPKRQDRIVQRYRAKVQELRIMFVQFELLHIVRQENRDARSLARKGFRNTVVDRSSRARKEIRDSCSNPENAMKYIEEHSIHGCQKIQFILDTMLGYELYDSHVAVQVFAHGLMVDLTNMQLECWCLHHLKNRLVEEIM